MRDCERYEKRVGSVVDSRWRIDSLLGWGSTSAVYAATHRNGHRAALKILHLSLCAEASMTERFLREAGIANAIKHRAIVPINDDGITEEGCAYLVLDLLEGETLDALRERRNGRIPLEELAPIAEELMSAISAVHAAGIVHRDLKPQNVFITSSGQLKLLDFGTARIFDRAVGSQLSVAGLVIGTPAYMSPEQARGSRAEVDAQSDVWSLGAMIFTVLSGDFVHLGRDAHVRLLAAASKPARSLATVAPSVDDRVVTVVDRALAYDKKERWPDVQAMRIAFRDAVVVSMPTVRDLRASEDVNEVESSPGTVSLSEPALVMAEAVDAPAVDAREEPAAPPSLATPMELVVPAVLGAVVEDRPSSSEAPAVSSTRNLPRVSAGIPLPALALGLGAMAAVVLLVVFFVAGGDALTHTPSSTAAATSPNAELGAATNEAPASSFMVISAPDDPAAVAPSEPKKNVSWAGKPMTRAPLAVPPAQAVSTTQAPVTPSETSAISASTGEASPAPEVTATGDAGAGAGGSGGGGGGGTTSPEPEPKGGAAPSANGNPSDQP